MALIIEDRVKETSTSVGTGAFTLAGAMTGYKAFSSVCTNADTLYYTIQGVDGSGSPTAEWEVGVGSWGTGGILTRSVVLSSSNADTIVNFSSGDKQVWIDVPASQIKTFSPATVVDVSSTAYEEVATLPNATTCTVNQEFVYVNNGEYDKIIKDFSGTTIGYLEKQTSTTIKCLNNSTSAGEWLEDLARVGVIKESVFNTIIGSSSNVSSVQLDSNRQAVITWGGDGVYCTVYNSDTNVFGSPTLVRTTGANITACYAVIADTDKIIVVSILNAAVESTILTFSGATVTVGAPTTLTLSSNIIVNLGIPYLVRVGNSSSFAWLYTRSSNITEVRVVSVSGTTSTIGSATTISAQSACAVYSMSDTTFTAVCTNTSGASTTVQTFSVSGTTITAGTAAVVAGGIFSRSMKLTDGRIIVSISSNAGILVATISGTTTTVSNLFFSNGGRAIVDWVEISPTKVLFAAHNASSLLIASEMQHALIDGAGVVTLSTAIPVPAGSAYRFTSKSGTNAEFFSGVGGAAVGMLVDSSSSTPSVSYHFTSLQAAGTQASNNATGEFAPNMMPSRGGLIMIQPISSVQSYSIKNGRLRRERAYTIPTYQTNPNTVVYTGSINRRIIFRPVGAGGNSVAFSVLESV